MRNVFWETRGVLGTNLAPRARLEPVILWSVYSSQPSCTKVVFHEDAQDDSVTENREGIEQNTSMPPAADHENGVSGITFVDDSVVAVVAVGDTTDLAEQDEE